MNNEKLNFIQSNSPDGALKHTQQGKDFLQSEEWRKFQESVGRKTFNITSSNFWANIIEHSLPIVGKYFYIPRGPVLSANAERISNFQFPISKQFPISNDQISKGIQEIIELAKNNNIGWIRIEPANSNILEFIKNNTKLRIKKAPHDMQPREILMLDITKSEEELMAEMKQKTRYNIRLAQKHKISVRVISNFQFPISNEIPNINDQNSKQYIDKFIELVKITAKRDRITPHPESYYRKMFEIIPCNILKLYVAEYQGQVIAANLMVFYGKTATYLHGASDNEHRNLMAPYLLQWQAIQDAKSAEYTHYDFGGINTKTGEGITKFKTGFAPNTAPVEFPGSYDIIVSQMRYRFYIIMQKIKSLLR